MYQPFIRKIFSSTPNGRRLRMAMIKVINNGDALHCRMRLRFAFQMLFLFVYLTTNFLWTSMFFGSRALSSSSFDIRPFSRTMS